MDAAISRTGFLFLFTVFSLVRGYRGDLSSITTTPATPGGDSRPYGDEEENVPLFTMNYARIQIPFEITLWVLLASFAKIGKKQQTHEKPTRMLP